MLADNISERVILNNMGKLYIMFCMPSVRTDNEIEYSWINKKAKKLYYKYGELLQRCKELRRNHDRR